MPNTRHAGSAQGKGANQAHGPANPAPERGMSRDVINVGRHIFAAALRTYREQGIPSSQLDLLEWLYGYAFSDLDGSRSALERELGYDWARIFRTFTAAMDPEQDSLPELCREIQRLQRKAAAGGGDSLVQTVVTKQIFDALDYGRDMSTMVLITGQTGRSKTFAAESWLRADNQGRGLYVRCPSSCSKRKIIRHLCRVSGIGSAGKKTTDLEERIAGAFNARHIIIFDEAGHLLPQHRTSSVECLEFVRDLHDMCGCGVALVVTDVYWDELLRGALGSYLEQFVGRIKYQVRIPRKIFKAGEIRPIVEAFTPKPSDELLAMAYRIASGESGKLRILFDTLRQAAYFATRKGEPFTAAHVRLAEAWRQRGGDWPEE